MLHASLAFTKMNGAGNDFVMLDNRNHAHSLTREQVTHLCNRHRGIGADGVLVVESSEKGADYRMRYYNADGGEAEMCGNGARCFARYAARLEGKENRESISFETLAGTITAKLDGDLVELEMSEPHSYQPAMHLPVDDGEIPVFFINTGVPHAVVFVDELESVNVVGDGAAIRYHSHFAPKGTNANFVQILKPGFLAIRTYERGVENETLACGTGVVASSLIYSLQYGVPSPIKTEVRGGDILAVNFTRVGEDTFTSVSLKGPADFVFEGSISFS